jgi:hypothetical protein
MPFAATTATQRYQPRPQDASHELFESRLAICQKCPLRFQHECRAAKPTQLVTVLARHAQGRCPTGMWPGQAPPPPRPLPIWRHDSQPIPPQQLGPVYGNLALPALGSPVRNLLCHIYPQTAGGRWRRTAEHLCARRQHFDGRRVIAVARDHECDRIDDVKAAFAPLEAEFLEFDNDPNLGEVATLPALLESVADHDPRGITFYCHGKGASWPESTHPAHEWADVLFAACLDYPELVTRALATAVFCGSLRRTTSLAATVSPWHFSGTFFWFRHDIVFDSSRNGLWRHVERTWGGTEAWPSLQVPKEQSACLFLDDAGDLYDPHYWDTIVRPAFRAWRNSRRIEARTETRS